jgi:dehydrogenase/reductase SDR family member 12
MSTAMESRLPSWFQYRQPGNSMARSTIELHEEVDVPRPPGEVFAYVSDFTTTVEWDSTARTARKLSPGPISTGTEFCVVCDLPVGSITIMYRVTLLEPNRRIQLSGSSKLFDIQDNIELTPSEKGTHIDYRATFLVKPLLQPVAGLSRKGLEAMGRESVASLGVALEDCFPLRPTSASTRRSDKLLLPGLALFTRLGYTRGRRHFNPMSASIAGRHVIVTGANAGIGYATALELARRGAQLTLVIRDRAKAEQAVAALTEETGNSNIRFELADLSLMSDVQRLVDDFNERGAPVDVLINNAGALFNPRRETAEGLENSYALLLLGPSKLTLGLKPLLVKAGGGRVINVVSGGMYSQKLKVSALMSDEGAAYSGSVAYARQKRALMVMTEEWAKAWADEGVVVNAMHPGWADTPGVQSALPAFRSATRRVLRSPFEGADTIVWLAVASEAGSVSGKLFLDREIRPTHLLAKTREPKEERDKLLSFLAGALQGQSV